MKNRNKKQIDTVPEIYMSGTDMDFFPVRNYPLYSMLPSTVIPKKRKKYGDEQPEYYL